MNRSPSSSPFPRVGLALGLGATLFAAAVAAAASLPGCLSVPEAQADAGPIMAGALPGACSDMANPDVNVNCTSANASAGNACTQHCCITCGIEQTGLKLCYCSSGVYINCACLPPTNFEMGRQGGDCVPQGYATSSPPEGEKSLAMAPCTNVGAVCFTADSTMASERGCYCAADHKMHCGAVNHWFQNNGVPVTY